MKNEEDAEITSVNYTRGGKPIPNEFPTLEPSKDHRIAIIGDHPDKTDDYYHGIFLGEKGKFLESALSRIGIVRSRCLLANVTWLFPAKGKIGDFDWYSNRIQCGIRHLIEDLEKFKPTIVLTLGDLALHVMKEGNVSPWHYNGYYHYPNKVMKMRGTIFESKLVPGIKCLATLHPKQILIDYSDQAYFLFDLKKLKRECKTTKLNIPRRNIEICRDLASVKRRADDLINDPRPIALDIEGSQHNITAISFADSANNAWVIPFAHVDGSSFWSEGHEIRAWEIVKRIIEDPSIEMIAQNGTYDFYALAWALGIVPMSYNHDTILAWWELYPELRKGLDVQASVLTNEPFYKPDKAEGDLKFKSDEEFWHYNGNDSAVTFECWERQMEEMTEDQKKHYKFNMELQSGPVLYMMLRGIRYDEEKAAKMQRTAAREAFKIQHTIDRESGRGWSLEKFDDQEILELVIPSLCAKKLKVKEMVDIKRWKPMAWNGKRWVKRGKMIVDVEEADLDGKLFEENSIGRDDEIRYKADHQRKEKLVDRRPKNLSECEPFILKSKREDWKEVKRAVAQIRQRGPQDYLYGQLSTALSVNVNVGSTQADGDAQIFLYDTCQLPRVFVNPRGQLSVEQPCDLKARREGRAPKYYADRKVVSSQPALDKLYAVTKDIRVLWVLQLRRLRKVVSDLNVKLDPDKRLRSSISLVKETGRMAESASPGGTGLNRQALNKDLRCICVADPGRQLYQFDLEGADNWTVAAECKRFGDPQMFDDLKAMLKPAKVLSLLHKEGAVVNEMSHDEIKRRLKEADLPEWLYPACKAATHGCVTGNHEVLTPSGWVRLDEYKMGTPIMVYDLHTRFSFLDEPDDVYQGTHDGPIYELKGNSLSQTVTPCHKLPYTTNGNAKFMTAEELHKFKGASLPISSCYAGGHDVEHVQLIAAFQADGTTRSKQVAWHFKKQRKILRIQELLREANVDYRITTNKDGSTTITTRGDVAKTWHPFKQAGPYLLGWNVKALRLFLDEHAYWDGYKKGNAWFTVSAVNREHLEWLATVSKLVMRSFTWNKERISGYGSVVHSINFNNRSFADADSLYSFSANDEKDLKVYCPVTSTGYFLVRHEGKISVTGNSSYGMGWRTMADTVLKHSMSELPLKLEECKPLVLERQNIEDLQGAFFTRYKGVKAWQKYVEKELMTNGMLSTSVGHSRKFYGRKVEWRNNTRTVNNTTYKEALASMPQFYTTYAMKLVLHNLWFDETNLEGDKLKVEPILCVHDSLLAQARDMHDSYAREALRRWFYNEIPIAGQTIVIPAEGTVGNDWGMKGAEEI